jgi:hypothetical protein
MSESWAQPSAPPPQTIAGAALSVLSAQGDAIAQPTAPTRAAPSLLRFVDHDLMQSAPVHNHPRHPTSACSICLRQWDAQPDAPNSSSPPSSNPFAAASAFVPLYPCGHWVHYRCLIWRATRHTLEHDKCAACGVQLFVWEGITALTLATRTGLDMEDAAATQPKAPSDLADYETECGAIDLLIHAQFHAALLQRSEYSDGSPNLVRLFYGILNALQHMKKPAARWLQYSTQTGYLLYGTFVAIKMRRYLVEAHGRIQGTEGWVEFEEGRKALQGRILGEVHTP